MNLQRTIFQTFILALIAFFYSCHEMEMKPESDPIESSELSSPTLKTIKIGQDKFQYEEYADGTKIVEGDIILPESFIEKLELIASNPNGSIDDLKPSTHNSSNARISGLGEPTTTPYTGGIVYFYIDSDVPDKNEIYDAVNAWESSTILDFVELSSPGSNTSSNWIHFKKSNSGCSSTIANFQTLNVVKLSAECTLNNVKHEIGHAIGLFHEHQRIDRDDHVEIVWDKIPEEKRNQYRLLNTLIYSFTLGDGYSAFMQGSFDFNSIMIYNTYQTINKVQEAVILRKVGDPQIIKTGDITVTDAQTVNRLINEDTEDKLIFSPYDVVISKQDDNRNEFNFSWSHNGAISGLSGAPNEFWLFRIDPGTNDEWKLDRKISGGGTRSYTINESLGSTPRWRLAAVNTTYGSFSASDEAIYDFSGSCSCSDDAELGDAVFIDDPDSENYFYQIGWSETPSGYSDVQLGYTTNAGAQVVLKDDFVTCETGWDWFHLPNKTASDGPSAFWLKAISSSGNVRKCNGNLWSSYINPK